MLYPCWEHDGQRLEYWLDPLVDLSSLRAPAEAHLHHETHRSCCIKSAHSNRFNLKQQRDALARLNRMEASGVPKYNADELNSARKLVQQTKKHFLVADCGSDSDATSQLLGYPFLCAQSRGPRMLTSWEHPCENDDTSVADQGNVSCVIPKLRQCLTTAQKQPLIGACPSDTSHSESEPEVDEDTCTEDDSSCTDTVSCEEL